jgi:hypothetical protein
VAELHRDKYITFNREQFEKFLESFNVDLHEIYEIKDAVVIRRQDLFASPCLLTYATMITMVAQHHPNQKIRNELQIIADYFHNQGVLAGEEGWKLPTP